MNQLFITFRGLTSSEAYKKIKQSNKLWIIRESAPCIGIVTTDFFNEETKEFESHKFAYIPKKGWYIADNKIIMNLAKKNIDSFIFTNEDFTINIEKLVLLAQSTFKLSLDNLLIPKESHISPNYTIHADFKF